MESESFVKMLTIKLYFFFFGFAGSKTFKVLHVKFYAHSVVFASVYEMARKWFRDSAGSRWKILLSSAVSNFLT